MSRPLVDKVKEALENVDNGDPLKDFLEDDEIIEALRLLAKLERLSAELSSIAASDPTPEMLRTGQIVWLEAAGADPSEDIYKAMANASRQQITRFDIDMDGSMEPSESGQWVRYGDL